jgi:hypothetical protein
MDYNTKAWFDSLAQYRTWNERAVWAMFALLGRPKSYLDLGAGDGWMVRAARMAGCKPSIGIDVSAVSAKLAKKWAKLLVWDLGQPLELRSHFELVSCIEVAEHMAPEAADVLVDNIAKHARKWVVFTAAPPGQGGDGHINCQPAEYWKQLFLDRGMTFEPLLTEQLQYAWKHCTGPMFWLPQNVQVFSR